MGHLLHGFLEDNLSRVYNAAEVCRAGYLAVTIRRSPHFLKNFTNETKWPNNLISKSLKIKVTNRLLRDLEQFHQKYPASDIKLIKRANGKFEWISMQEYYRENLLLLPVLNKESPLAFSQK
jgi:hypothetical protein